MNCMAPKLLYRAWFIRILVCLARISVCYAVNVPKEHELVSPSPQRSFVSLLLMIDPSTSWAALPKFGSQRSSSSRKAWTVSEGYGRRELLTGQLASLAALGSLQMPSSALARAPGSVDINECLEQVVDARQALAKFKLDFYDYATIDKDGRADVKAIDAGRAILGGVAPQRGKPAIEKAKNTPLYRIDNAFKGIRQYAINAESDSWAIALNLEDFLEVSDEIVGYIKRVDEALYDVVFAPKGSTQIAGIYKEALQAIDLALADFDKLFKLLRDAKAPSF